MNSVGWYVFIVWLLVRSLPAPKSFGALDCRADGGFGHCAQGLGFVVLITTKLDLSEAVGAGFDGEGVNGGVCAEGAAGEALTGWAGVGEDLAAGEQKGSRSNRS